MTAPMTRRQFTDQIAYDWVTFDRDVTVSHGADRDRQPLDRAFAFGAGSGYIKAGRYTPRDDYRYMDWGRVASEARKAIPGMRRMIDTFDA